MIFNKKLNFKTMEPRIGYESTEVNRNDLDWLQEQPMDVKIDLLQNHLSICQIIANQIMEEEVRQYTGLRYSRERPREVRYCRWASNPGSIRVGDTKIPIRVPRIRNMDEGKFESLESYQRMKDMDAPTEQLIKAVLKGLSMRDYKSVIDHMGEGFGLSKSAVSERFVEKTSEKLQEFMERDLRNYRLIAMFIDGKSLGGEQIIVALGVTEDGRKIPLEFIQSHSEHSEPVADMLRRMQSRGVDLSNLLYVLDGSKGFRKAVIQVVGPKALIQRCSWHKFQNIKSYLPESEHSAVKSTFYKALDHEDVEDAKADLLALEERLRPMNVSAANSLLEGIDELLTLHRIEAPQKFHRSFQTTNCIESLNSQLQKYIRKVTFWKNSDQRYRWVATGLLDAEEHMRRVPNYRELPLLQKAILLHYKSGTSSRISTKVGT
jgi:putative transposase